MIPDVYAQSFCKNLNECLQLAEPKGLKYASEKGLLGRLLSDILPIVLGLAGFVTVIIIVISGIQFITSSGNPEAAAAAKNRLVYAIVGFVVIILAFALLQIIDALFLGTEIV